MSARDPNRQIIDAVMEPGIRSQPSERLEVVYMYRMKAPFGGAPDPIVWNETTPEQFEKIKSHTSLICQKFYRAIQP